MWPKNREETCYDPVYLCGTVHAALSASVGERDLWAVYLPIKAKLSGRRGGPASKPCC